MKKFLFLSMILATASSAFAQSGLYENNGGTGGALSSGWWLISVIFGVIIPAILIYQGTRKAAMGSYVDYPDGRRSYDYIPQPWHKHGLSRMGVGLAIIAAVATIVRIATFS